MSSDNVVPLFPRHANPIEALESIIERLKSGELASPETGAISLLDKNGGLCVFAFGEDNRAMAAANAFRLGEFWLLNTMFFMEPGD